MILLVIYNILVSGPVWIPETLYVVLTIGVMWCHVLGVVVQLLRPYVLLNWELCITSRGVLFSSCV